MAYEIERRFRIERPPLPFLAGAETWNITQTYCSNGTRVRRIEQNGVSRYILTYKRDVTALTRIEEESEISASDYLTCLRDASADAATLRKTRYRIPWDGHVFEIDLFAELPTVLMEVELKSEDEPFTLPPFVRVIDEVTEDPRWRNAALARALKRTEHRERNQE